MVETRSITGSSLYTIDGYPHTRLHTHTAPFLFPSLMKVCYNHEVKYRKAGGPCHQVMLENQTHHPQPRNGG